MVVILTVPSMAGAEDLAAGPTLTPTMAVAVSPSTLIPSSEPPMLSDPSPTAFPTSMKPTTVPTMPRIPTSMPTVRPTFTPLPSHQPSPIPTGAPTGTPSSQPTAAPSFETASTATDKFRQKFTLGNDRLFTDAEILLFQGLYENYTVDFAPEVEVDSTCEVTFQAKLEGRRHLRRLRRETTLGRALQTEPPTTFMVFLEVDYTMSYTSVYTNVTTYPADFKDYVSENLIKVVEDMRELGLNVTEAATPVRFFVGPDPSMAPTITPIPTIAPSMEPSGSFIPSDMPSLIPTTLLSDQPSIFPSANPQAPTEFPSQGLSGEPTKGSGTGGGGSSGLADTTVIVVSIAVAGSIVLIGLLLYYRKRKLLRELEFISNAEGTNRNNGRGHSHDEGSWNAVVQQPKPNHGNAKTPATSNHLSALDKANYSSNVPPLTNAAGMVSPSESLVSNQSLLSAGNSMAGDSGDEADATGNLADEFDQYKDQNLEKMRADVEGNLTGFDGMMSQALTRALIDDDDVNVDPAELLWGGSGKLRGAEIEASALGEVTDWLKRKQGASVEEKRLLMQDTLNKMVASVRHGVLGPDDASRSIHECAALLGLQLATEIPVTTLIITGMRKTVAATHMMDAFKEFGEISEAAVASNQRGFGILRFKTNQSVDRAMNKFRNEEIVVQDVAVHVKILKPGTVYGGAVDSSGNGSSLSSSKP